MTPEYKKAVQDLVFWQEGQHFFTCELYSLFQKADHNNQMKLAEVYPVEFQAFRDWYTTHDPELFFERVLGPQPTNPHPDGTSDVA